MTSAATTHIGSRTLLTVGMIALIAGVYWLMRRGWQRQARGQSSIPAPQPVGHTTPTFEGIYASTTYADQPLKRIVVHGLGGRTSVEVGFSPETVELYRRGSTSFAIPRKDILSVSRSNGMAGKFVGDSSLTVITWKLGEIAVDTGLLIRDESFAKEFSR